MARKLAQIADEVWVATSRNYATTSTIIARDGSALLIDPAWEPDELTGLAEAIQDLGLEVTTGFHTHAHHDHLLWYGALGPAPRWVTPLTLNMIEQFGTELRGQLGAELEDFVGEHFARVQALTADRIPEPFGAEGPAEEIVVVEHNGHAYGHAALWFPERKLLVAGDMLSDIELPLPFNPHGLEAYLPALDTLAPYVEQAAWLIPGHGTPTDMPSDRLVADRLLLDGLLQDEDVADARRQLPGGEDTYLKLKELAARYGAGGARSS